MAADSVRGGQAPSARARPPSPQAPTAGGGGGGGGGEVFCVGAVAGGGRAGARGPRRPPPRRPLGPDGEGGGERGGQEGGGGTAEQEALTVVDPQLHERLQLSLPLDALGDDRGADAFREGLEGAGHLPADVAGVDGAGEL